MTALGSRLDRDDAVALLSAQTELLEQIASGVALGPVLDGIATTLEGLLPGSFCSVLLLDPEHGVLLHGAAPSLPGAYSASIHGMAIGENAGSCGTAAFSGEVVVADDIRDDPRWTDYRSLADGFGLRACWSTPIRGRTGVSGTFAVYHRTPHRPTSREEQLVQRLTHLASVAIDHDGVLGALAESEERFRRAFEDNAVGMALATPDGVLTRVNTALSEMFGATELVGARLDELFARRCAATTRAAHDSYEATAVAADGRALDVAVAVSPIRTAEGTPHALSVNVLDITGRRAAERERHRRVEAELARTAAEAANRAKSDFVRALGHELRTPLQAITGFTELLSTLELDAERRAAALVHIDAAAGHILEMVDEVLDVARIEAGALPVARTELALLPIVTDVLAMVGPLAAAERVTLRADAPDDEVEVFADERRVRQVLLNVVTNAIRYNRTGGAVCVEWRADADGVVVTVRDTGPGIAADDLDRIFTPFDRLGRQSEEGIGLGLPLARGLAEAMGGGLQVSSEIGRGTCVSITLPLLPDDGPAGRSHRQES